MVVCGDAHSSLGSSQAASVLMKHTDFRLWGHRPPTSFTLASTSASVKWDLSTVCYDNASS